MKMMEEPITYFQGTINNFILYNDVIDFLIISVFHIFSIWSSCSHDTVSHLTSGEHAITSNCSIRDSLDDTHHLLESSGIIDHSLNNIIVDTLYLVFTIPMLIKR